MSDVSPEQEWFEKADQEQLCVAHEPAFETLMSAAEILGEYGTTVRYPMEGSEAPDVETAKEAIRLAEQVVALVLHS